MEPKGPGTAMNQEIYHAAQMERDDVADRNAESPAQLVAEKSI